MTESASGGCPKEIGAILIQAAGSGTGRVKLAALAAPHVKKVIAIFLDKVSLHATVLLIVAPTPGKSEGRKCAWDFRGKRRC